MNTTYFIGAGASAGRTKGEGIPVVSKTADTFNEFKNSLINFYWFKIKTKTQTVAANPDMDEVREELPFVKILEEIDEELIYHETFDTIARKYWLVNDLNHLNQLKYVMNLFYVWLQGKVSVDKRYDKFFSIILNKKGKQITLPENLKFISWNYDLQPELASLPYFNATEQFGEIFSELGIIPFAGDHANRIASNVYEKDKFHLIKLNGTVGIFNNPQAVKSIYDFNYLNSSVPINERIAKFNTSDIINIFKEKEGKTNKFLEKDSTLQFAFERGERQLEAIEAAKKVIADTKTLVVIGYSFPSFNREIDIEILKNFPYKSEIIIQDINPSIPLEIVKDIFMRLGRKVKISETANVSQFNIPFDFRHDRIIPRKQKIVVLAK